MRRTVQRLGVMLALLPLVLAGPACSPTASSTPRPSAATTTTSTTAPEEFVSKRYAFRLTLTTDWAGRDATVDWDGKALQGLDSPDFATFTDPGTGRALVAAAAPVAAGMALAAWQASMARAAPSVCTNSRATTRTRLGGEPAVAWPATCSDGYDVENLAALHAHRGYMLFLASPTAGDHPAADRSLLDSIRRSFRFEH